MAQHEQSSAKEHALVGAGVGVAGAANTIGLIGISAGTLAALPIALVAGAIGGLFWWAVKSTGKDS